MNRLFISLSLKRIRALHLVPRGFRSSARPATKVTLSDEQMAIYDSLENSRQHAFITGKAGTGKSALLEYFASNTGKSVVKVAPTGVAAMNIKGQTIHSLFKLPTGLVTSQNTSPSKETRQLLRGIDVILIDEISMVRADTIDGIDHILRLAKRNKAPFGGAQIIAFGDMYQLPPVVNSTELRNYFEKKYGGPYFFKASVWSEAKLNIYELQTIFRQSDKEFKSLLNEVRSGHPTSWVFGKLRARVIDTDQGLPQNIITLTSTNAAALDINNARVAALRTRQKIYSATIAGDMAPSSFPTEKELMLKVGAQVIFIKNDPLARWVNGTIGIIKKLSTRGVKVQCKDKVYEVELVTWETYKYNYDEESDTLTQEVAGSFTQLPLKLAWAITIHKSQGSTYNKVAINVGGGAFAHGQTYVALSRCRSLAGLYLLQEIKPKDIIVDPAITDFMSQRASDYETLTPSI